MRTSRLLLFLGCVLILLAAGAIASKNTQLKAGIPANLPEVHLENGRLVSPYASLLKVHCIEQNLSYPIRWDAYPAARLTHLLESGSVDFALPLSASPQRDARFGTFIPLGSNTDIFVSLELQLLDNSSFVVGVMRGTIQAQIAEERGYQLLKVNEIEVLIKLLLTRRVDAIIVTEKYFNANELNWAEPIHSTLFRSEYFGIYFSKNVALDKIDEFASANRHCNETVQQK